MSPVRVPGPHGIDDSAAAPREVAGPGGVHIGGEATPYRGPGQPPGPPGFHAEETPIPSGPLHHAGPDYLGLESRLLSLEEGDLEGFFETELPMALIGEWLELYRRATVGPVDLGEYVRKGARVLFDGRRNRRIATLGLVSGEGEEGGEEGGEGEEGEEFDLAAFVPSDAGWVAPFGPLEKEAGESQGALYFVRLVYAPWNAGQRPDEVEQGLVRRSDPRGVRVLRFGGGPA